MRNQHFGTALPAATFFFFLLSHLEQLFHTSSENLELSPSPRHAAPVQVLVALCLQEITPWTKHNAPECRAWLQQQPWAGGVSGLGTKDGCCLGGRVCQLLQSLRQPAVKPCCVQKLILLRPYASPPHQPAALFPASYILALSPLFHTPSKCDEDTVF